MKPVYEVTIGSLKLSNLDEKQGGVLGIATKSEVGQINEAKLVLPRELEVVAELDDQVEVSLGETKPEVVFSGVIGEIKRKLDRVDILAVSLSAKLSTFRTNRLYEQRTCGDIAKDLIEEMGVPSGKLETGLEYPVYTVDSSSSVYEHLEELSMQNGLVLHADVQDQLTMTALVTGMTHLFAYGKNILSFEREELQDQITGYEVYGESPLSHGQGKEAYSWLSSKEVLGIAGDKTGSVGHLINPALKNIDAAQLVADNMLLALQPGNQVKMKVPGNSRVKLLDQFMVKDIPGQTSSSRFLCLGINHIYGNTTGFGTQIIGKES